MNNKELEYVPRTVREWMTRLADGRLKLPMFQRSFVWKDIKKSKALIDSLMRGRPVGTMLLIPNDDDKFPSRFLLTLPEQDQIQPTDPSEIELVLDGQQRLTSLWRAFKGETELYIKARNWESEPLEYEGVYTKTEAGAKSKTAASPPSLYERRFLPFRLLGIDNITDQEDICWNWCREAIENDPVESERLYERIQEDLAFPLQEQKIWHLTLPAETTRHEAIDIFVKSNDVSVRVSKFDICVAQCDAESKESLRNNILDIIKSRDLLIRRYFGDENDDTLTYKLGDLIARSACLRAERKPDEGNFIFKDVKSQLQSKDSIHTFGEALDFALNFYMEEGVLAQKFIPTDRSLRVLTAIDSHFKKIQRQDQLNAEHLLRAYLWRSFMTEKYAVAVGTNTHQDYKSLRHVFEKPSLLSLPLDKLQLPFLNEDEYPLRPYLEEIGSILEPLKKPSIKAGYSRGIFAMTMHGAKDFATGRSFRDDPDSGDYQHIFAPKLLKGLFSSAQIDHCLNFAYLSEESIAAMGNHLPCDYLAAESPLAQAAGMDVLRQRVESQLIPFGALAHVTSDVESAYDRFIKERAKLIRSAMEKLARGETP